MNLFVERRLSTVSQGENFHLITPFIRKGVRLVDLARQTKNNDLIQFSEWLLEMWIFDRLGQFNDIVYSPSEKMETLPHTETAVENTPVFIHGIVHDSPSTNPLYAEIVRSYVTHTLDSGELWMVAAGFEKEFKLPPNCTTMNDIPIALPLHDQSLLFRLLHQFTQFSEKNNDFLSYYEYYKYLMERFRANPHVLKLLRAFVQTAKLPEPLDMEIALMLATEDGQHSPVITRSLFQAREISRKIRRGSGDKPVHVLTGIQNESQVVYLLENPTYDPRNSVSCET